MKRDEEYARALEDAMKRAREHWVTLDFRCRRCGNFLRETMAPPTEKLTVTYFTVCSCNVPVITNEPVTSPEQWERIFREMG